jgi:hypothetical protein
LSRRVPPKAKHDAAEWQTAMEALLLVVKTDGPTMLAAIAITQALNKTAPQLAVAGKRV